VGTPIIVLTSGDKGVLGADCLETYILACKVRVEAVPIPRNPLVERIMLDR
jgi:hypothetical protein